MEKQQQNNSRKASCGSYRDFSVRLASSSTTSAQRPLAVKVLLPRQNPSHRPAPTCDETNPYSNNLKYTQLISIASKDMGGN